MPSDVVHQPPIAEELVCPTMVRHVVALAEGQLPSGRAAEAMPLIKRGEAALAGEIAIYLLDQSPGASDGARVVDRFRIRVLRLERNAVGVTMYKAHLQAVVERSRAGLLEAELAG